MTIFDLFPVEPPNSRIKCPTGAGDPTSDARTEFRSRTKFLATSSDDAEEVDEGLLAMEALNLFKQDSQQNPTVSPSSLSANRLGSIGRPGFIGQSVLMGVPNFVWPSLPLQLLWVHLVKGK